MMANVGYSGLIVLLIPLIVFVLWITMVVALFQIRNGVRETSEKLNAIYKLLSDRTNSR